MFSVVMGLGNKDRSNYGTQEGMLGTSCQMGNVEDCISMPSADQENGQKSARWPSNIPTTYLEEGEANVVLKDDTAYAPHITWL